VPRQDAVRALGDELRSGWGLRGNDGDERCTTPPRGLEGHVALSHLDAAPQDDFLRRPRPVTVLSFVQAEINVPGLS